MTIYSHFFSTRLFLLRHRITPLMIRPITKRPPITPTTIGVVTEWCLDAWIDGTVDEEGEVVDDVDDVLDDDVGDTVGAIIAICA